MVVIDASALVFCSDALKYDACGKGIAWKCYFESPQEILPVVLKEHLRVVVKVMFGV